MELYIHKILANGLALVQFDSQWAATLHDSQGLLFFDSLDSEELPYITDYQEIKMEPDPALVAAASARISVAVQTYFLYIGSRSEGESPQKAFHGAVNLLTEELGVERSSTLDKLTRQLGLSASAFWELMEQAYQGTSDPLIAALSRKVSQRSPYADLALIRQIPSAVTDSNTPPPLDSWNRADSLVDDIDIIDSLDKELHDFFDKGC